MSANLGMLPLLAVALIVWAGIWLYTWALDRRVRALERRLDEVAASDGSGAVSVPGGGRL